MPVVRHKVGAGSAPFTGAYHLVLKIFLHTLGYAAEEYLVAHKAFFRVGTLEGDVLIIEAEVCLCIITAGGQLLQVLEVLFVWVSQGFGFLRCCREVR